jgi:hypothetical protein
MVTLKTDTDLEDLARSMQKLLNAGLVSHEVNWKIAQIAFREQPFENLRLYGNTLNSENWKNAWEDAHACLKNATDMFQWHGLYSAAYAALKASEGDNLAYVVGFTINVANAHNNLLQVESDIMEILRKAVTNPE